MEGPEHCIKLILSKKNVVVNSLFQVFLFI